MVVGPSSFVGWRPFMSKHANERQAYAHIERASATSKSWQVKATFPDILAPPDLPSRHFNVGSALHLMHAPRLGSGFDPYLVWCFRTDATQADLDTEFIRFETDESICQTRPWFYHTPVSIRYNKDSARVIGTITSDFLDWWKEYAPDHFLYRHTVPAALRIVNPYHFQYFVSL